MNKYLLSLLAMMIPALVQAEVSCVSNPIYCNIVKLKPDVDKAFAKVLSDSIYKYSKMFNTDPTVSVAIAMQESSFENKNRVGSIVTKSGAIAYGVTDVGVFQLHVHTIANLQDSGQHIDVRRLESDVDYQTYWHVKILKGKISTCISEHDKLGVREGSEWSCYHSFTPAKRKIYLKDVSVHLAKITTF